MMNAYPAVFSHLTSLFRATALLLLLPATAWAADPIKLEAEAATLRGITLQTATAGYSGAGYAGDFDNSTDSLVFLFPAEASKYSLTIRYTSPQATKTTSLVVNGTVAALSLPGTGAAFGSKDAGTYSLRAGQNRLAIAAGQGYFGIDYIELTPVATTIVPLVNGRAEAEQGDLRGVTVATSPTGFSGTGFVTGFDNSDAKNVSITFDNPTAGLYKLTIGYTSPFGFKAYNLTVNGEKSSGSLTGTTTGNDFSTADAGSFLLTKGLNEVVIGGNYGYYGIDYVEVTPTVVALPAKPPKQLTDPAATASTRSLHAYLVDLYGTKILAGQQDDQMGRGNSEVAYVLAQTGKEPAIASMDLYDYSTAPVATYGEPNGTTERYLDWATRGNGRGIVSLIWHWRAPADLNDPNDPSGAFYTKNTSFDIAAVLADKTGTRYQLLLRDIDLIAAQLQKFQAAGVPVLWRPLHETPGTFFWWGAKGPAAFKELWQLLHDRLTNQHNLHNLIWVYSTTDAPSADWYPGDQYVDIAGEDLYLPSLTANMSGYWTKGQELFAPRKLVALTETGTLLDPDRARAYGTWWSWFCAWQGQYIREQPLDFLRRIYTDPDIITRDELADWYSYAVLATRSPGTTPPRLAVYPNPVSGYTLNLRLQLASAQTTSITLVNTLGQRVAATTAHLRAGDNQLQVPVAGLAAGVYQLVVRTPEQGLISQRVMIQ